MKQAKAHLRQKKFGNSVLAINHRFWTCLYCGKLIGDGKPFLIININGNTRPYDLCSHTCLKLQVMKIEATHVDKE